MAKRIFSIAMYARKEDTVEIASACYLTTSEDVASIIMLGHSENVVFPIREGWLDHGVRVCEVPESLIDEVILSRTSQ